MSKTSNKQRYVQLKEWMATFKKELKQIKEKVKDFQKQIIIKLKEQDDESN